MIEISDKPNKRLEYFSGTLTMAVPYSKNELWNFTVIKTTNGSTSFDVTVDEKQIESNLQRTEEDPNDPEKEIDIVLVDEPTLIATIGKLIQKTVLANIKTQKVLWQPTEK